MRSVFYTKIAWGLAALALAAIAFGPPPPARAGEDLAAWCSRVGIQPVPGPGRLWPGISFKARIVGRDSYQQRFKVKDVRRGDLVIVTLLAVLPGNQGWLQIINLRTGNVTLLKY
jgi:hypothetical protein